MLNEDVSTLWMGILIGAMVSLGAVFSAHYTHPAAVVPDPPVTPEKTIAYVYRTADGGLYVSSEVNTNYFPIGRAVVTTCNLLPFIEPGVPNPP